MTPRTDDEEFVPVRWTMGPPSVAPWLEEALWNKLAEQIAEFERGMWRLVAQCAPAIGVHQGCEHDEEATG